MFYDNELRFLQKTLEKCHIQTKIVSPDKPIGSWGGEHAGFLFSETQASCTLYDLFPEFASSTVYRVKDAYRCRYLLMDLPYTGSPSALIIGPYLNVSVTHQMALEQSERMGADPHQARKIELYYSSLPVVRDENFVYAVVTALAEVLWNGEENFSFTDWNLETSSPLPILSEPQTAEAETLEISLMEKRYEYENELMDAVAHGNMQKAEMAMSTFSELSFEERVPDRLRNLKNYCIITNTLMRKAAQRGGVHPVHLDQMSSDFAGRLEQLRSTKEATAFVGYMMQAYCRLVKSHSMKNFSPLVQKAMVLIEHDLTSDLSLNTVAKRNNVSPGYLSGLFKKECGQTFTAYVNSRRIHHAKHLLKTTNLQIQTIAQHCGILDINYFSRLFKQLTGMTPTKYRDAR